MTKDKELPKIFDKERHAFDCLWHNYHAKHMISYDYDEEEAFFNSVVEIFREDKE